MVSTDWPEESCGNVCFVWSDLFFQHQTTSPHFAPPSSADFSLSVVQHSAARFYLSETGTMGLTNHAFSVAFMTDSLGDGHGLIALPIIAAPLIVTTLSVIIQLLSKKIRGQESFSGGAASSPF